MSRTVKVFIDESGDDSFSSLHDFLIIVAVAFKEKKNYREFHEELLSLKKKWFGRVGEKMAIHAYELFNPPKKSHWQILGKERVDFLEEYTELVKIFARRGTFLHQAVLINKSKVENVHRDWYATAFCMAIERIDRKICDVGKIKVFAESRNPTKDDGLFREFTKIIEGRFHISRGDPIKLKGKYYNKLIFLKKGKESGLDLADSIAYLYQRLERGITDARNEIKKRMIDIFIEEWRDILERTRVEEIYKWPR